MPDIGTLGAIVNQSMSSEKNKKAIDKWFTPDRFPPLFADTFRELKPEWRKIHGLDFETTGRILICHLILEHYLTRYIEFQTPKEFTWNESRLTFSQKLNIVRKTGISEHRFDRGIEIINQIRNKFSHNLEVEIDQHKITELKEILNGFGSNKELDKIQDDYFSDVAIIEVFTNMVCAYIAGHCVATVERSKKKISE